MSDELAREFAISPCGLVVAPAGCGKTHLISETVRHCSGRQLVLTHTHAGVKAIRDRMVRLKIPSDRFRILTIDAFALRYASAFPTISGWSVREPEGDQWHELRPAAAKAIHASAVEQVMRATYEGIFVDEYQDCSSSQHDLIVALSQVLPCRVLGDPLQSIFWKINEGQTTNWTAVENTFPLVGELKRPHRWEGKNELLGQWLLDIRPSLLAEKPIDLSKVPGLILELGDPGQQTQLAACQRFFNNKNESVVGLRQWRNQCHSLADKLNNAFSPFEDAHCEQLLEWAGKIDGSPPGNARVKVIWQFAQKWLTRLPKKQIEQVMNSIVNNKPTRARRSDLIELAIRLKALRDSDSSAAIPGVLIALEELEEHPVLVSPEIWRGLKSAAGADNHETLRRAAWHHRDLIRRSGRHPWRRCLATPLLVKGLEFDHAIILDASDFKEAESLYVCLTRATRTVTVLSSSKTLHTRRMSKQ